MVQEFDVLVLGGGYAGLLAALRLGKRLAGKPFRVGLVDRNPYHTLVTELHRVAAGTASPTAVRIPFAKILKDKPVSFVRAEVHALDLRERRVDTSAGALHYKILLVALGGEAETYGIPGVAEHALSATALAPARLFRYRLEHNLARYAYTQDDAFRTVVIGGAGFTGVELAGELAFRAPDFREAFDLPDTEGGLRIFVAEATDRALPPFPEELGRYAARRLAERGVRFLFGSPFREVREEGVLLGDGTFLPARTVAWCGGVRAPEVLRRAGFPIQNGRIPVGNDLRVPGFEDVFAVGDVAFFVDEDLGPLPPTAQTAIQMGPQAAENAAALLTGGSVQPLRAKNRGAVATLGPQDAVGCLYGRYRIYGRLAFWTKRAIEMRYLAILRREAGWYTP
ncbi:NAD(P)/FAD-dependent oxidoreductase [Brockia lithotrophica]|uniref:NADH dehydrogenase FAD-containing subunit n=1 Tax=Brockia lithotrophica TaxID=933949 RepID=A0A660KVT2_9BACL|nr:NAD(P)/FAD-dependent oxidoreductase [Brockia lithotrophica]RKQ83515.1 NADH dehydrogenase FAD-containing subunit [Brockia lithotrophica]